MKGMQRQFHEGDQDGAPFLACDDADGLQAAAQMAAIELHTWGSALPDAGHADRLVFDLDPGPGVEWATTVHTALELRERLGRIGLAAFCRTSGGKGLHVVVPVAPGPDWDTVRAWCRAYAEAMEADAPDRFVASVPKARANRAYPGGTGCATGSARRRWRRSRRGARPGAPVATPVMWREGDGPSSTPAGFSVLTVPKRLGKLREDPWEGFAAAAKPLPQGVR